MPEPDQFADYERPWWWYDEPVKEWIISGACCCRGCRHARMMLLAEETEYYDAEIKDLLR